MTFFRQLISLVLITSIMSSHVAYAVTPPGSPRVARADSGDEQGSPPARQMAPAEPLRDQGDDAQGSSGEVIDLSTIEGTSPSEATITGSTGTSGSPIGSASSSPERRGSPGSGSHSLQEEEECEASVSPESVDLYDVFSPASVGEYAPMARLVEEDAVGGSRSGRRAKLYGSLNATGSPVPSPGGALVDVEATGHRITPALVKRAYKGDESARALVAAWVRRHQLPDQKQAHDKVWVLKYGGGAAARLTGDDQELYDTVSPRRSSERAPLLQGSLEPYDLTTLQAQPFPNGYEDPELRNKMLGMLTHLHRYTIMDEITWKQWAAIVAAVALGGWAINAELPVFDLGVGEIFYERLHYESFFENTRNVLLMESYVGITAGIDNLARLTILAKMAFSPSAALFMNHQQRKWPILIVCGFVTGLFQLFYFVDAETTFISNAEYDGVDTKPFYNTLYAFTFPYFVEGVIWGMDLAVDFMGQIRERYFTPNPKSVVRDPLVVYRDEGMQTLSRLKQAVYWMPPQLVQTLYENLFDTQPLENLRERNPDASPDDLEAMLSLLKIKYLFSTGSEILGDELNDEEHHMSTFAKVMSFGAPAVASVYRYLALQIVFSLMLKEFSFGLVDEELAKKIAYGLALLGSIPQGFIEVAGNVAFFEEFVPYWSGEAHSDVSIPVWRAGAHIYAGLESVWNLIPLVALCLDTTDEFFGGNMYWMLLSIPFLFSEFTGSAITLLQSYVKIIPTMLNRAFNESRTRCFGKQLTVGYMRDEVLSAIERQEKIFKGLTPEALAFYKSEICEGGWD